MRQDKTIPRVLFDTVAQYLHANASGISEFDLLKHLRYDPASEAHFKRTAESIEIFRQHFLLMHILYALRDEYWQQQSGHLEINPLAIRLGDYHKGNSGLQTTDKLRDYYLNIENLFNTSADDVDSLFKDFWKNMDANQHREQDLQTLGLQEPVSKQEIRDQYRRLAMEHHPDRGGDHGRLQEINQAMVRLLK